MSTGVNTVLEYKQSELEVMIGHAQYVPSLNSVFPWTSLISMVTDHFTHRDYPHKVTDSIIITTEDATKDLPDFLLALNLTLSFEYILFKNASGPVLGLKHFLC
jgi:hypothetical protein